MAADRVASRRQPDAALEPALREFEPMDTGVAQLRRERPIAADHEHAIIDQCLDLIGINPRQRNEDEQFPVGFQDVDRRFPARPAGRLQVEKLLTQPLRTGKRADGLRQHPVDGFFCHLFLGGSPVRYG